MLSEVIRSTDNTLACEPFHKHVSQEPDGLPQVLLAERGGELPHHPPKFNATVIVYPTLCHVTICKHVSCEMLIGICRLLLH